MPDQLEAVVQRMIDAGESEENIAAVIQSSAPPMAVSHEQTAPSMMSTAADMFSGLPLMQGGLAGAALRGMQSAKDHPAETGGLVGAGAMGLATGGMGVLPAAALAGLGGAGGAGYGLAASQIANRDTQPAPTEAGNIKEMATQGAINAAGEGGVGLLRTGLRKIAPKIMDAGLWRSGADRLQFPGTPQRLVDEGIVPGGGRVQAAMDATEAGINSKAAEHDAIMRRLGLPGSTNPFDLATEARASATTAGKLPGLGTVPGAEDQSLRDIMSEYMARNPRSLTQAETIAQKRAYQARASYSPRVNAPTVTNEQVNFDTGLASAARNAAIKNQPSIEGALAKEKDLLGALVAEQKTGARGTPSTVAGIARHVLMSPGPMGAAAIGADRASKVPLQQLLRAALLAQMGGQEPAMAVSHEP